MNCLKDIPRLEDQLRSVRSEVVSITADPLFRQPLGDIIDVILHGQGKLLRPALVLLCGRLGPAYPDCEGRLIRAAAIVELTHMASLIHDDIVDDAPLRRGRPTVQSSFGKDMAVYAGDYLLSRVLSGLLESDMPDAGRILARGINDMCSGELSQHEAQYNIQTDESRYFMSISGKTAALFSASCEIGAVLSGCDRDCAVTMSHFGHSLGILFQLRDDLKDCLPGGDEGKILGTDFVHGIYTLPVLYSFTEPSCGEKLRALAERAANGQPDDDTAQQLYSLISTAGGIKYTRWIMGEYKQRALSALEKLPESAVLGHIRSLLDFVAES